MSTYAINLYLDKNAPTITGPDQNKTYHRISCNWYQFHGGNDWRQVNPPITIRASQDELWVTFADVHNELGEECKMKLAFTANSQYVGSPFQQHITTAMAAGKTWQQYVAADVPANYTNRAEVTGLTGEHEVWHLGPFDRRHFQVSGSGEVDFDVEADGQNGTWNYYVDPKMRIRP